jgi:hypothetical protein
VSNLSGPVRSGRAIRILALAVMFGMAFGLSAHSFTCAQGRYSLSHDEGEA